MKKFISAVIASAVAVSALVPVFAENTFSDVPGENYSWAYSYVEEMVERGFIRGYEDGTFRPGNAVSRMDAFSLFARLMGSNAKENETELELAKEEYAELLSKYELEYAEGDVAFMLSRGVITERDLDTYLKGTKKKGAMQRYEAAILITKAMLGEQEAKDEVLVDMDYSDVADIPKSARQYVYYVSQKGVMSGMGNGEFSPNSDVLRGQIAVMLSKTAELADYKFEKASILSIDTRSKNLKVKNTSGSSFMIGYDGKTVFSKDGKTVEDTELKQGQEIVLTYLTSGDDTRLAFVDVARGDIDEKKSVIFKDYSNKGGTVSLMAIDPKTDSVKTYTCSGSVVVTAEGRSINMNNIKVGSYITIGLVDDTVVEIEVMQKNAKINAEIEKISSFGTVTISSTETEYDGMTLSFAQDAMITKNGDTAGVSELGRGDSVQLTLESGLISKVIANSVTKTVTGVLKGINITDTPTITVNRDGTEYTFDITVAAEIFLNDEKAKLSDLAIGNTVAVTAESNVVKKITVTNTAGSLNAVKVAGKVVGVYESNINIETETGETLTVSCTRTTRVCIVPTLGDYAIKMINNGDTIEAYGEYVNGAFFVAEGIIVIASSK